MTDILKETPMYRHMTQDARKDGLEEGRAEGRAEALRQVIVSIVAERFPTLTRLTQAQVTLIENTDRLQQLVVRISVAQSAEDAKWCLVNAFEEEIDGHE